MLRDSTSPHPLEIRGVFSFVDHKPPKRYYPYMHNKKTNKGRIAFFTIIALLFFFIPALVTLLTNWWWFQGVGFQEVFLTIITGKFIVGGTAALLAGVLLYTNVLIFKALSKSEPIMSSFNTGGGIKLIDIKKTVAKIALPVVLVVAAVLGFVVSSAWEVVYAYIYQTPFGSLDPIFGRDVAYYVFSLPFIELVLSFLSVILFISFFAMAGLYAASGTLAFKNRRALAGQGQSIGSNFITIGSDAKKHLFSLVAIWFFLSAAKIYFMQMPNLLYSPKGIFEGAGYTDIYAVLPFLYLFIVVAIIVGLVSLRAIRRGGVGLVLGAFLVYAGVGIVGNLYPAILQGLIVKPNELVKETPYIKYHIDATQEAWGLDNVIKRDLTGDSNLTQKDIQDNRTTIENIRLWDREPLLDTFGQLQEIRTYYDFVSVDNDRYVIDGEYRQVLLSPRELNVQNLPQKNFINERLTFTHGVGVTLSPVNEKTQQGLPELFIQDIPPTSRYPELDITRPEIYYSEKSNDYVFVNTNANEFDYPLGEENIYATYTGVGGVQIKNTLRKALFAARFESLKVFLSDDITNESRVMYYRNVKERVATALPFLSFDADPYMVINEGRLVWMFDGYTETNKFPYSASVAGKNYMRNAVKVVVDAYDGSINAYIADSKDPIIQTYAKMFPEIFVDISEMPESLRKHVRYPEDLFSYQSALYSIYHMEEPQIFYNKEDLWQIPRIAGSARGESTGPILRHLIMKLPEEEQEEFILMLPYTPQGKNNMAAWMVARSDGDNYGQLVVYRFPKQRLVFGPKQIVDRINQDAEISQQISLWDQGGSQVVQGNLFVIPINESILYIRPLYIRAEGGRIPELKRVIVAYENEIAMEETLDSALTRIFGGSAGVRNTASTVRTPASENKARSALIQTATGYYNRAQSALRSGDFARYGEEMKKLGDVLRQLSR